jgi:glycerol-3-phosphate dehydrogenase
MTLIRAGLHDSPSEVDVLVVGLGVTGAGCALDAVSRGLSVLAVDAHDLAFGTSRWSSKLVHGGLRYVARGQFGVAHESAVERGILMEVTAPHLTQALPMLLPIDRSSSRSRVALLRAGIEAGDLLRIAARTSSETLPMFHASGWGGPFAITAMGGTHVVLRADSLPGLGVALTLPVAGERTRFVNVVPQPDGLVYVGLTDVPVDGPVPDVADPSESEIEFLLAAASAVLTRSLGRADVVGAYAGLRPLLRADGRTADLSRRHAVLISRRGVVTIVGGKLTTYRRMAQDAIDAAVARRGLDAGSSPTARLPLIGAAPRPELARLAAESTAPRLVRRFGTDARLVLESARQVSGLEDDELLAPVAAGVPVTLAELLFGVTHEGAHDTSDLLDRRTRVGLVPADRAESEAAAQRAFALTKATIR